MEQKSISKNIEKAAKELTEELFKSVKFLRHSNILTPAQARDALLRIKGDIKEYETKCYYFDKHIHIKPGKYTENIKLCQGINITGEEKDF